MKRYDSIMKRVRRVEEKYGIQYAKMDGKLFKTLTVLASIVWVYTFFMNLLYILGSAMQLSIGQADFSYMGNGFITICVSSVCMVVAAFLFFAKFKAVGSVICAAPLPVMALTYVHFMEDINGLFGITNSFYWRHGVPAAILFLLCVWMLVICVRERVKTEKQYKRIVDNLYNTYHTADDEITEEQWEEFLQNYSV